MKNHRDKFMKFYLMLSFSRETLVLIYSALRAGTDDLYLVLNRTDQHWIFMRVLPLILKSGPFGGLGLLSGAVRFASL